MGGHVVVRVEEGLLKGRITKTVYGKDYVSFQGVPYAKPPVGPLRFKAPEKLDPWEGIKDALHEGPVCAAFDILVNPPVTIGQEDCLYMNIYTPQIPEKSKSRRFPVMVFIHGGGFSHGDGGCKLYGPDFLVGEGVVLVTFNYRLGVLGFLSTNDEVCPGNFGLKDQVAALKWVQTNIDHFGGQSDNVTIFGESAGAISVHLLMLSPLSRGLFHGAICQSGVAMSSSGFSCNIRNRAFRLGEALGLKTDDSKELIQFLMGFSPKSLVEKMSEALTDEDRKRVFPLPFIPTVENNMEGAFLTEDPLKLITDGRIYDVPWIVGFTSAECLGAIKYTNLMDNLENFDENFISIISPELVRLQSLDERLEMSREVKKFYFGDNKITKEDLNTVVNLLSDLYVVESTDAVLRTMALSKLYKSPIYYYCFSSEAMPEIIPGFRLDGLKGANHTEDLCALFKSSAGNQNLFEECDEGKVRKLMVQMWTNFAKTKNPTPNTDELVKWVQYSSQTQSILNIDSVPTVQQNIWKDRMDFWYYRLPPGRHLQESQFLDDQQAVRNLLP